MGEFKGAFRGCQWCYGRGCFQCDRERQKAIEQAQQPIFTADRNDPEDMEALKRVFHADNITKEFGPGGGGIQAIRQQAALEAIEQLLRKASKEPA